MTKANRSVSVALMGVGNVGRRFLELLMLKQDALAERLALDLKVVGVADTSGVAASADGLDPRIIVDLKAEGQGVASYPGWGRAGGTPLEMVGATGAELLLDASPANMQDGQPGLSCVEAALSKGMHVVTANKVPLVLAFSRLEELAQRQGVCLRYDATVAGGLPAVNLGRRDLAAASVTRLEGVLNLTTNYILTRMADDGLTYEEALVDAQVAGHAETDPTLDVEGWDAANKLVILAHSVLGQPSSLDDIPVEGITNVTMEMLEGVARRGKRLKLVATAIQDGSKYHLSVRPTELPSDHPLAQLGAKQMGIVYCTDISGVIAASIVEETPVPTASAMLRDLVDIYSR